MTEQPAQPAADGTTAPAAQTDVPDGLNAVEAADRTTIESSERTRLGGRDPIEAPAAIEIPPGGRYRSMRMLSLPFVVAVLGVGLAIVVVLSAGHALFVFAIGIALSFFLVPVVNRMERHMPRIAACILVVIASVLVSLSILVLLTAILLEQGAKFLDALPAMLDSLQQTYQSMDLPTWLTSAINDIVNAIETALSGTSWGSIVVGFLQGFLGIVGTLFAFLLLPFFLFYLLKDQPRMARNFYRQVPRLWKPDLEFAITTFIADFAQYFKAELLVGAIMGVTVAIGMTVIGLIVGGSLGSFALLLGLIAFVMELIPQIGPIISYIPALIISLTISPLAVVLVSVFYFIAFNIEGSVLVPTFEGRMISFSGATVLLLITIGFALGGILGAIVALPVAAIVRDLFAYFFRKAQRESIVIDHEPADPGSLSPTGPTTA